MTVRDVVVYLLRKEMAYRVLGWWYTADLVAERRRSIQRTQWLLSD